MGGFPEDHEINLFELIRLWVAEGFLKCTDQSKSGLEKMGEDFVRRSLIIITKRRANGQFKLCKMHDVVREFCREKAASKNFFHFEREWKTKRIANVCRLFLSKLVDEKNISFHSFQEKHIHSVLNFRWGYFQAF